MSFFSTKEYKTLVKIKERLGDKCTLKNVLLYLKYLVKCIDIAEKEFNNVGWDGSGYRWDKWFYAAPDESNLDEVRRLISAYGSDYDAMIRSLG